ncbi:hypothetical protein R6242_20445 [Iodobacter sp. CM08]|uniref:hypothetical protein n=1 Tax=Iodobacter sp. CM08 TaxID=3085902 RepID=UPI0029822FF1|nr:hypothetical protein [Iodobacter sp. CM08]MDW5418946.1 hypothetical protein [Iodobacter sp. CM08]
MSKRFSTSARLGFTVLNLFQFGLIIASGVFRKKAWLTSDYVTDIPLPSPALTTSNWLFIAWLASIALAALWAIKDKNSRLIICLVNLIVFPSLQFFWFLSYAG